MLLLICCQSMGRLRDHGEDRAHALTVSRVSNETACLIAGWFQFKFHTFVLHLLISQAAESERKPWRSAATRPRGGGGAADPALLSVLEQDKDINYHSISYRLRPSKVDLASLRSFTFLFHQLGRANFKLLGFLWSALARPSNQTSRMNTQTHSHKLRAGPHKLPETQQEVFFCGQKLSQLEHETEKDTLIGLHRRWQEDFSRHWVPSPRGCGPNKRRC